MGATGGRWDFYFDLFAENPLDFQNKMNEILYKFKDEIQEYETCLIPKIHVFNYKYFSGEVEPKEFTFLETGKESIDETDKKILLIIKKNARLPLIQISLKVKLNRIAVKERIKRLHEKRIIAGNRLIINPSSLKIESYKILFKLKNDEKEKQKIMQFSKEHKNIIYAMELMGKYDLDLKIEIENREKLQKLLITIRNKFPIIENYEIMPLFYDTGIDHFPINKK